jgi:HPt (histidine-containing phosphotransfer) domain-containing protein
LTEIKRQLREWGADPDGAIERMMNDEAFYGKMLNKFAAEDELSELGIIARQDPKEGFRIAHNLKGTAGTLGLTPLYDAVCEVVEDLRGEPKDSLEKDLERFADLREQYFRIIGL